MTLELALDLYKDCEKLHEGVANIPLTSPLRFYAKEKFGEDNFLTMKEIAFEVYRMLSHELEKRTNFLYKR